MTENSERSWEWNSSEPPKKFADMAYKYTPGVIGDPNEYDGLDLILVTVAENSCHTIMRELRVLQPNMPMKDAKDIFTKVSSGEPTRIATFVNLQTAARLWRDFAHLGARIVVVGVNKR